MIFNTYDQCYNFIPCIMQDAENDDIYDLTSEHFDYNLYLEVFNLKSTYRDIYISIHTLSYTLCYIINLLLIFIINAYIYYNSCSWNYYSL